MSEESKTTLNLLLLEDSENDELLIRFQLESRGGEVRLWRIESEKDLRAALEKEDWDLVIGDYGLPGFDGLAALAIVREHDPDLPFIMVSGMKGEEFAVEAMRAGAGDYITKDHLSRLLPAIERELAALDDRRARRQADAALRRKNRLLELLSVIGQELLSAETPVDAASSAYRKISGELGLQAYFHFLVETEETLRLDSWDGIPQEAARLISRLRFGQAICGIVAQSREAIHVTDIQRSDDSRVKLLRHHGFRAYYCSPLCVGERLLGTLSFGTRDRDRFTEDELEFIATVVRYVALAAERIRAGKELRGSERRLRAFFENAAVGATEMDIEGRILRVNDFFCDLLGYRREELTGRIIHDLTHPEHVRPEEEGFQRVVRGECPFFEIEKKYCRKDGTPLWVQETTSAIRNREGKIERLAGIIVSIQKRKESELQRRDLLAELEATINSIADAVVIYGPGGKIARMNPAALQMFGLPPDPKDLPQGAGHTLLGAKSLDGTPLPPERFPGTRALRGEKVLSEVVLYHSPGDGRAVWGAVSAAPIYGSEGSIIGAVSTITDVTALHELQQEKEVYVHTISHDLRTPLSVVMGHAELLETTCPSEDSQVHVEAILKGAERMETMIENLVEAARLEGGDIVLNREPVWVETFIPEFLRQSSPALELSRISVDLPPHLPPVSADPARLERILTNLLTNALKYSPGETPVTVTARSTGDAVLVSVRDQGQGIDPSDLPHIFKKFHRPQNGRKAGGVGLGLYITSSLVEAHGGRMHVDSERGRGSTFTFSLPVHRVQ